MPDKKQTANSMPKQSRVYIGIDAHNYIMGCMIGLSEHLGISSNWIQLVAVFSWKMKLHVTQLYLYQGFQT